MPRAWATASTDCIRHFRALAEEFQCATRRAAPRRCSRTSCCWRCGSCGRSRPTTGSGRREALRDTLVQRYRALVERHFHEHRPLAFYADALDVTADHLSRVCRAVSSTSALALLHERMALEAQRMLVHTR